MALALSPQQPARSAVQPIRTRTANPSITSLSLGPSKPAIRLSVECRTRRNREVQARYLDQARASRRGVYLRRRIVVGVLLFSIAAAACLGVRAMASRGDGTASLPTVTPLRSALVYSAMPSAGSASGDVDLNGAFARGEQMYVVQPGDTLWSIASSLTTGSIRSFVEELIDLNGAASIEVGQRLVLPAD